MRPVCCHKSIEKQGVDAPTCQDTRLGGLGDVLARAGPLVAMASGDNHTVTFAC